MRLEIESTLAAPHILDESPDNHLNSAEAKAALNHGIKAAQAGNRVLARASLLRATELDPSEENAWLWLASISEYPEELLAFLNRVLEINPENGRALEWKAATNSLLSKTFVQRGVDAVSENQKEFAVDCFQTALEYDDRNASAMIWLASLADSNSAKVELLERALQIDPANTDAAAALNSAKGKILKQRLADAKTAAVSGNNAGAIAILDELLATNSDSVEAWTMRLHLAEGFDEKIRCFESILAIDPENMAAKAGRDSLLSLFGTIDAATSGPQVDHVEYNEPTSYTASSPHDDQRPSIFEPHPECQDDNQPNEDRTQPTHPLETEAADAPPQDEPQQLSSELSTNSMFEPQPSHDGVSAYADPRAETVTFTYDHEVHPDGNTYDASEHQMSSAPEIPMPDGDLPTLPPIEDSSLKTNVEVIEAKPESVECPFCGQSNEPQSYSCQVCKAVLTLSDLELLLANQNADKLLLRQSVEEMERRRLAHEASADELVTLGIGHLNLRNLQIGYSCLLDASKLDPQNVVLSGQVNSLLIRLDEIKQQEEAHLKMPRGKSILVVDDSPTVRKLISGKLEKCGHDVICASDGVEAMERLDHFVPDLVLLDITMPRMDGYQVCKSIRNNSATKDVPVVMISGKDGFFDKVRGRMAGTTGYITKPFGPETLMKAVETYLSGEVPESDEE